MLKLLRTETEYVGSGRTRRVKIFECTCGTEIACGDFTNTCEKCGADYNWNGARLADRSQWGCETGESVADILSVDGGDW